MKNIWKMKVKMKKKMKNKRSNTMAFDAKKYNQEWKDKNRDHVRFRVPKGNREKIALMADKYGKSSARFIKDALYFYMDALGEERINLE